ncbi:MAG: hypothetical protein WCP16_22630 [Pseudanabaena sp. ELA645]|jgi:predicted oxidoreductase (fatty acid repression mutant protein)
MGFEDAFVFLVVGCVASYLLRSQRDAKKISRSQIILMWTLAIALPSLAIAWMLFSPNNNQITWSLMVVVTGFLLSVWLYRNLSPDSQLNAESRLTLSISDEKQLRDCFPHAIYQLRSLDCLSQEIYCRGIFRSQNHKYVYDIISENLQKTFGDRFLCYLQESPIENFGSGFGESENAQDNQSVKTSYEFYLVATKHVPNSNRLTAIASIISLICTAFTLLLVGANIHHFQDLNLNNLQASIPYSLAVASVLVVKAIAQYYISKKNKLKLSPPLWLPSIGGFGILGSVTTNTEKAIKTVNPINQRRILFDLAAIPIIAGLTVSITLLVLGNWLLVPASSAIGSPSTSTLFSPSLLTNLNTFDFKNSMFANLLQGFLQILFSFNKSEISPDAIPAFSPLTLAGWTGLALSALQLMPFDLLDGGNLAIAMFGHRQAVQIARIVRLVVLAIALLVQPWLRIYSLLLFLLPNPRSLICNESIEIDRKRDLIGMILMAIGLLIILPASKI